MISSTKKIISFIIIFLILINAVCLSGYANKFGLSWYVKRTKDHSQPELPPEFSLIKEFNAIYVDKDHFSDKDAELHIYLTFDAGYENGNVEKTLDILKENEVKGSFFILSHIIDTNPELIKRMSDEGHLVCNHTATHKDVSEIDNFEEFRKEIENLESKYTQITGKNMAKFFRPPEGRFSRKSLEFAEKLNYRTVFWSFAYEDWNNNSQMSREAAKKKIFDNIHNGAILLLHPTSSTNAEILGEIIAELKSQGYRFKSIDEIK